jgi:hypothetical protein
MHKALGSVTSTEKKKKKNFMENRTKGKTIAGMATLITIFRRFWRKGTAMAPHVKPIFCVIIRQAVAKRKCMERKSETTGSAGDCGEVSAC